MHRTNSMSSIASSASDAEDTMQIFVKNVPGTSSTSYSMSNSSHPPNLQISSNPYDPSTKHLNIHPPHPARRPHQRSHSLRPAPRARRKTPVLTLHHPLRLQHPTKLHLTHGSTIARWHASQEDPLLFQTMQRRRPAHRRRLRFLLRSLLRQAQVVGGPQVRGTRGLQEGESRAE